VVIGVVVGMLLEGVVGLHDVLLWVECCDTGMNALFNQEAKLLSATSQSI
jgi:hypothetical protein